MHREVGGVGRGTGLAGWAPGACAAHALATRATLSRLGPVPIHSNSLSAARQIFRQHIRGEYHVTKQKKNKQNTPMQPLQIKRIKCLAIVERCSFEAGKLEDGTSRAKRRPPGRGAARRLPSLIVNCHAIYTWCTSQAYNHSTSCAINHLSSKSHVNYRVYFTLQIFVVFPFALLFI